MILTIVAASMIPYFLSFDLPKQIVNGPIQGKGFGASRPNPDLHAYLFRPARRRALRNHFQGLQLTRFWMLRLHSGLVFLALVILNGLLFKLYINTYKGRLGEAACCAASASS